MTSFAPQVFRVHLFLSAFTCVPPENPSWGSSISHLHAKTQRARGKYHALPPTVLLTVNGHKSVFTAGAHKSIR